MSKKKESIKMRGMYRVQITAPNDQLTIVGDSGWRKNTIVNKGYQDFLCALLGNTTGSKQVKGISIGSGTAPNVTHDTLDGEISSAKRMGGTDMTVSLVAGSKTVRFTATFYSSRNFLASSSNIRNIGLFDCTTATGSLFAGSTYTLSSCDTNQNVNVTYDISFS